MRSRISGLRCGRPPRERDFHRQKSRQPCRCQRTTVSGATKLRCWRQPAQNPRARTHTSLSHTRSRARGRVRVGRISTASWWRRSKFSSTRSWRGRTRAKTAVTSSQSSSSTSSASPIGSRPRFCPPTPRLGCAARCEPARCASRQHARLGASEDASIELVGAAGRAHEVNGSSRPAPALLRFRHPDPRPLPLGKGGGPSAARQDDRFQGVCGSSPRNGVSASLCPYSPTAGKHFMLSVA